MAKNKHYEAYWTLDSKKIKGETQTKGYEQWIAIEGYEQVMTQARGGMAAGHGGLAGGRPDHEDFRIYKRLDASTPDLMKACNTAMPIKKAELVLLRSADKGKVFLKYTFEDVIISSVKSQCNSPEEDSEERSDPFPAEVVTMRYNKYTIEYTPYGNDGKPGTVAKSTWNIGTGQPE